MRTSDVLVSVVLCNEAIKKVLQANHLNRAMSVRVASFSVNLDCKRHPAVNLKALFCPVARDDLLSTPSVERLTPILDESAHVQMQGSVRQLARHLGVAQRAMHRTCASSAAPTVAATPAYVTQPRPVYSLPYYGAPDAQFEKMNPDAVKRALAMYGGLVRKDDEPGELLQRLQGLANASFRPKQLTIEGVVVSDKMDKSVVVAARRKGYAKKLDKTFFKTRRFMAHDELNLCREGDRVRIRSCRPLSRSKAHVVVQNFGDSTRAEPDTRTINIDVEEVSE